MEKRILIQEKAHVDAEHIFRTLLPQNGLSVRKEQLMMCHHMLDALFENKITLCDAGVGIGKTYAYLTACVLFENYKPHRQAGPGIVISTSSVALQDAIVGEYIPFLSRVFLENGIIQKPIRASVRKGKERFVCDLRLAVRLEAVQGKAKNAVQKGALAALKKHYDLDDVAGLSGFDRRLVCVPKFCPGNCSLRPVCRYHRYLQQAKGADIFLQICNHNYLLADATHKRKEFPPLLCDYHLLVIDEAHKLPEAAGQMYGKSLAGEELTELCELLARQHYTHTAQRLKEVFGCLMAAMCQGELLEDTQRTPFILTARREAALKDAVTSLQKISRSPALKLPGWIRNRLGETSHTLNLFYTTDRRYILYIRYDRKGAPTLCCSSREVPENLQEALWEKNIPTILTSGTLMAGGSFARTEQMTGLAEHRRVIDFIAPSPFDYQKNCLLYLPRDLRHVRMGTEAEIHRLAGRIRELVERTCGHTLVLFTSYALMGSVYQELKNTLPFPLLEVWRHSQDVIHQFKQLPNAVLFAAGSCWEGVDFPGDMVSSLIVVRLPFPVPDPLSEAEREQYPSLGDYIRAVVIPDMQRRLRQGFGRAIRTETDTCVVTLLDSRAAPGGRYHRDVLEALPPCRITGELSEVEQFIRARKAPDYFS